VGYGLFRTLSTKELSTDLFWDGQQTEMVPSWLILSFREGQLSEDGLKMGEVGLYYCNYKLAAKRIKKCCFKKIWENNCFDVMIIMM